LDTISCWRRLVVFGRAIGWRIHKCCSGGDASKFSSSVRSTILGSCSTSPSWNLASLPSLSLAERFSHPVRLFARTGFVALLRKDHPATGTAKRVRLKKFARAHSHFVIFNQLFPLCHGLRDPGPLAPPETDAPVTIAFRRFSLLVFFPRLPILGRLVGHGVSGFSTAGHRRRSLVRFIGPAS